MSPRAVFMIDVSFEDVLDDFLSVMRVHLAFPSRGRHALREALEREKGLLVAGREQEVGRRIRGVNLPMDNRQFPRLCHLIEKGQAGVRYRFSVGRPSGEGFDRILAAAPTTRKTTVEAPKMNEARTSASRWLGAM